MCSIWSMKDTNQEIDENMNHGKGKGRGPRKENDYILLSISIRSQYSPTRNTEICSARAMVR